MKDTVGEQVRTYLEWIDRYVAECRRQHGTANINEAPPGYMAELSAILASTIMSCQKHSEEFSNDDY